MQKTRLKRYFCEHMKSSHDHCGRFTADAWFQNHDAIFKDLHSCQSALHEWGLQHQVIFEKTKESLHILCRKQPKGDPFKILGIHFDTKLVMYDAVVIVAVESGARLKMLLRARPFYCQSDLVCLYKCHVLPFIESGTPAYYHATSSILQLLDNV